MMFSVVVLIMVSIVTAAEVDFEKSALPIVVINTEGQYIPDEPKIAARMGIIFHENGEMNYLIDDFDHYDGYIGIERRGSSSAMFPKKQYAIETRDEEGEDLKTELMFMPKEEDWVLYAPYSDKTLMRNVLIYDLARELGWYASRALFCEVVINDDYKGIYVWMEKIKRDKNRVGISKLKEDENFGVDMTGGYILKIDKFQGADTEGFYSQYGFLGKNSSKAYYQYHYPDEDDITEEQKNYIHGYMNRFEDLIMAEDYLENSYKDYLNLESFADYFIINELSKNVDGYRLSSFFYKDKDDEDSCIYAGPVWDYNLAFGNADYYEGYKTEGWQWGFYRDDPYFLNVDSFHPPCWWLRLMNDPVFIETLKSRWVELRETLISEDYLFGKIDSIVLHLGDAVNRNYQRWPILGEHVWPNYYIGDSYEEEISLLKTWISNRIAWLDQAFTGLKTEINEYVKNENMKSELSVYPNPNQGDFTVSFSYPSLLKEEKLEIYDILGRKRFEKKLYPGQQALRIDRVQWKSGIYMIKLKRTNPIPVTIIK